MSHLKLIIEPIPASSRRLTLARLLRPHSWNRLRRLVYRRAAYRCQICGRSDQLHCHEVWAYQIATGRQWLRALQVLCRDCHHTKHLLFCKDSRQRDLRLQHFMAVNNVGYQQARKHMSLARTRQRLLNQRRWVVTLAPGPFALQGQRLVRP